MYPAEYINNYGKIQFINGFLYGVSFSILIGTIGAIVCEKK
jgi:hypothetical protein